MPEQSTPFHSTADSRRRRSPSFLQRLGNFDLFSNLIFNREKDYRGLKRLSPVGTSASREAARSTSVESENDIIPSVEDEETEDMPPRGSAILSYLKSTDMAVSKPRGRPPNRASAKATPKGRMGVKTTKKRSPPTRTQPERASKIQKTVPKANSGKRVNGGATITDVYVISDSEDENDLQKHVATESLTPPLKIDSPGTEDDLTPLPMSTLTTTPSRSISLKNELVRTKIALAQEVEKSERLQQELSASRAQIQQIKEDPERQALDLQRRQSITSDKQMADRNEELEIERRRTSDLTWELDHARKEAEAARSCLKGEVDLTQQRDDYERLYNEEKEAHADSVHGLEGKVRGLEGKVRGLEGKVRGLEEKNQERTHKVEELGKQIEDLQREVSDVKSENAALRISANEPPGVHERASPSPSMSSGLTSASDADLKLANIRKTYITVKKRYDNLHSVASNISTAARGWDYGSFGEFGAYLKQLKTALDENGPEEQVLLGSQAKID